MRDLIQSVHLGVGATSRRKVYIIDEVHMLSAAASNTLLKTLEEPPAHVVFVLATTDPQKVLPTIRSRTQHFEFTLLSHDELVGHLADILAREGVDTDAETLDLIARRAGGSARDALSLLDQALAVGERPARRRAGARGVRRCSFEQRVAVLDAAAGEDVAGVLVGVHEMMVAGHDSRRVADDLLRTLRDAFLCANAGGRVPYDGPAAEAERLTELAQRMGNVALVRGIEVMGQAIVDIRGQAIADPRLVLEVAVVRLARRESRTREETLLDRIERLEKQIGGRRGAERAVAAARGRAVARGRAGPGRRAAARAAPRSGGPMLARAPAAKKAEAEGADEPAAPEHRRSRPRREPAAAGRGAGESCRELDDVIVAWPAALDALKAPVRATIQEAQPIGIEARRDRVRRAAQALRRDQRALPQRSRRRSRPRSRRASASQPKIHRARARLRHRSTRSRPVPKHRRGPRPTTRRRRPRSTSTSTSSPTRPTRRRPIRRRGSSRVSARRSSKSTRATDRSDR